MNEAVKKYMSELGKKSWEARKNKQDMSALAKRPRKRKKKQPQNTP